MWETIQEGGAGGLVALGAGLVGSIVGLVALAFLGAPRRARWLAIAALVLSGLAPVAGILGVSRLQRDVAKIASDPKLGSGSRADYLHDAMSRARTSAQVGLAAGLLPLLLGATAALVSARRARGGKAAPLAVGSVALFFLGGALVTARTPLPPAVSADEVSLLNARDEVDRDLDAGCEALEIVLKERFWKAHDPREWPRHFDADPRAAMPDFDVVATRCARAAWDRATSSHDFLVRSDELKWLLDSPLLVDDTLHAEALALSAEPPPKGYDFGGAFLGPTHQGTVTLGAPSVTGRIPVNVIERISHQYLSRFRGCYDGALTRSPKLEGTITISFLIGRDGSVTVATLRSSTTDDPELERCVLEVPKAMSFPSPEGGIATVTVTLEFAR